MNRPSRIGALTPALSHPMGEGESSSVILAAVALRRGCWSRSMREGDRGPSIANKLARTTQWVAILFFAACSFTLRLRGADIAETKSALETDPQGWIDILPPSDIKGWFRVPVPPNGRLGREQWHVDTERKVLICDGD